MLAMQVKPVLGKGDRVRLVVVTPVRDKAEDSDIATEGASMDVLPLLREF